MGGGVIKQKRVLNRKRKNKSDKRRRYQENNYAIKYMYNKIFFGTNRQFISKIKIFTKNRMFFMKYLKLGKFLMIRSGRRGISPIF